MFCQNKWKILDIMINLSKFIRNSLISFKFNRNTLENKRNLLIFDKKRSCFNEFHLNSSEIHLNSTVLRLISVAFSRNQLYFIVLFLFCRTPQKQKSQPFLFLIFITAALSAPRGHPKHTTFFFFAL